MNEELTLKAKKISTVFFEGNMGKKYCQNVPEILPQIIEECGKDSALHTDNDLKHNSIKRSE